MQFSYLLLLLMQASIVLGIRFFHLGRRRGGNLRPPHYEGDLLPAQWFKQRLDHFTPTDLRMWKQRYFINDSFYDFNNPGPVFLMIGGEGPANPKWMVTGSWIDYAKKFNALCINLEHRYYGESHPTEDLSTKNLQYLSSHQALADLANFITAISNKLKINKEVRWIAFGGSYPGSLAAWLRMKYPHLIYASVSSSGPLLAKVNFMEYFQVVVNALKEKTGSDECVEQVKTAHKQIKLLAQTNTETLDSVFKLCRPLAQASSRDKRNFYSSLADDFAGLVQYNEDNRIGADPLYRNMTINTVCNLLTEPGTTAAFKKLGAFNSMMLDENKQPCLDYSYQNMVDELKNTSWNVAEGGRQWMYQTCTEFGFYQTSSGAADVFGDQFALDFFVQQCQDVFGTKFSKSYLESAAEWTNSAYGALDIDVDRVVFVHGSVDPWHALGMTATREHGAPAIFIKGTAHCANMYPPSVSDLPELKRARVEIQDYLASWLSRP